MCGVFRKATVSSKTGVSEAYRASQLRSWVTLFRGLPDVGVSWGNGTDSGPHDASNSVSRSRPGVAHWRSAGLGRQSGRRSSQV